MRVGQVHILATSAVRDASNSQGLRRRRRRDHGRQVTVLSGEEEAHFAALGVVAGIPDFAGVVGDLGGGSLELSAIDRRHGCGRRDARARRHPPAGRLRRLADKARAIARERLENSTLLERPAGGTFCAIGGTWRSLAKLHQVLRGYPLHMVQHYAAKAERSSLKLCDEIVERGRGGQALSGRRACELGAARPRALSARRCWAKCCGPGKFETRGVFGARACARAISTAC